MRRGSVFVLAAAVVASAALANAARAQGVRYELDSAAMLRAEEFFLLGPESAMRFEDGQLRIQSDVDARWWLGQAYGATSSSFLARDTWGRGARVEARLRLEGTCDTIWGPGFLIEDGLSVGGLQLRDGQAIVGEGAVAVDTSEFHTYRVDIPRVGVMQLWIDDVKVWEADGGALRAERLFAFGHLGMCPDAESIWEYVSIDTFADDGIASDADEDGVDDAEDGCALIADPDQLDSDGDGIGDVCDRCVDDRHNDADNDGICAPRRRPVTKAMATVGAARRLP